MTQFISASRQQEILPFTPPLCLNSELFLVIYSANNAHHSDLGFKTCLFLLHPIHLCLYSLILHHHRQASVIFRMALSSSLLLHPLAVLLIQQQLFVMTAAFTPSHSSLRPAIFALLVAYVCTGLAMYSNYTSTTSHFGAMLGGTYVTLLLNYFDRLIVRQWAFKDRHRVFPIDFAAKKKPKRNDEHSKDVPTQINDAPGSVKAVKDTFGSRFTFGQEVSGSGRMVDTPSEVKNVAPFSNDPNYVPSRASFVVQRTLSSLVLLVLVNVIMEVQMNIDPFYIAPSRVPLLTRLTEVTREELVVRLVLGIGKWAHNYCMVRITLDVPTIPFALVNPGEVRKMRPLFGSLSEACTVRGFWGSVISPQPYDDDTELIHDQEIHAPKPSRQFRGAFPVYIRRHPTPATRLTRGTLRHHFHCLLSLWYPPCRRGRDYECAIQSIRRSPILLHECPRYHA